MTSLSNIEWPGGYQYPGDLAEMYGRVDWNWCFDFSAAGANSAWLLPNRLYEGGLFHCPALALDGTETAAWLNERGTGRSFNEPLEETLRCFFESVTANEWRTVLLRSRAVPVESFCGEPDYAALSEWLRGLAGS